MSAGKFLNTRELISFVFAARGSDRLLKKQITMQKKKKSQLEFFVKPTTAGKFGKKVRFLKFSAH